MAWPRALYRTGLSLGIAAGCLLCVALTDGARAGQGESAAVTLGGFYQIANPSVGMLLVMHRAPIMSGADGAIRADISGSSVAVSEGMAVILYDDAGNAWREKGSVASVDSGDRRAVLSLPRIEGMADAAPARADIILRDDRGARRLPESAVRGGTVWRARAVAGAAERYTLEPVAMPDGAVRGQGMADVSGLIRADDYAVLNPDARLRAGGVIAAPEIVALSLPTLDPQEEARRAHFVRMEQEMVAVLDAAEAERVASAAMAADAGTCAAPFTPANSLEETLMRLRGGASSSCQSCNTTAFP